MLAAGFLSHQNLFSQKQNSKWYLGNGAALDFSTNVAVSIPGNNSFTSSEGLGAVSDRTTGALLFYSNGLAVYNASNTVMPNGNGLLGAANTSSTQGVLIAPKPGTNNLYYLFTSDETYGGALKGIRYSVIDMLLNGGLGDVVAGQKNILLAPNSTERLCLAVKPDSSSFWLMTHGRNSNVFRAFEITTAGINTTAVTSAVGLNHSGTGTDDDAMGCMKFNLQYNKIAICLWQSQKLQILNFNNCTGVVSAPVTVNALGRCYGVQFSPGGNLLYYSAAELGEIIQLNLLAGSPAAIYASSTVVGTTSSFNQSFGSLELAPDNKIYAVVLGENWISTIDNPDVPGLGCSFTDISTTFVSGVGYFGLPQYVPLSRPPTPTLYSINDTDTCRGITSQFSLSTLSNVQSVTWNFGDPSTGVNNTSASLSPTHLFSAIGIYTVTANMTTSCGSLAISRQISITNCFQCPATISGLTTFCAGGSTTLTASPGTSYLWSTGATTQSITVSTPGNYSVTVTQGTSCSASVNVVQNPLPNIGTSISLTFPGCTAVITGSSGTPGATFSWTGPATAPTATNPLVIIYPGTYILTVTNPVTGCIKTAPVTASFPPGPVISANDASICPGGSATLTATGSPGLYTWSPATGLNTTTGSTVIASPAVTTVYIVTTYVAPCFSYDSVTVTVANSVPASISGSLAFCTGGSTTLTANTGSSYLWSTGATTQSISVNTPGVYSVTVSQSGSCPATSASVNVSQNNASATISGNLSICSGSNTTLIANAGSAYLWSTGATTQSITVNSVGTYSVTVTQANSCTATTNVNVTDSTPILSPIYHD